MNVIGVDPGDGVGVATLFGDYFTSRAYDDPWIAVTVIEGMLDAVPDAVVACERYAMVQHNRPMTAQPEALEVTGALRYVCMRRVVRFIQFSPGDAARPGSPTNLRRLGWYRASRYDHANRAAAQVAAALLELAPSVLMGLFERVNPT